MTHKTLHSLITVVALASLVVSGVQAQEGAASEAAAESWGNESQTLEVGLFWGAFLPERAHELHDPDLENHPLEAISPELGLRLQYSPLDVLGLEIEGALLPTQLHDTGAGVNLYALRAQAMLLAPTKTLVPFLVAGVGLLGVSSESNALGSDVDGTVHFGIGAKAYVTSELALRIDLRDNITNGQGSDNLAQHVEILVGASLVTGREEPVAPPPPDADGDGVDDAHDACVNEAGVAPTGCPPPPPDADGDGVIDSVDACPGVAGLTSVEAGKNGCPPPPPDRDADGVPDADDRCPDVLGDAADGCVADTDGDGIPNRVDACADVPETANGFEDTDGCADEVPEAVKKFTGVIEGIVFDASKATIRRQSFKLLDAAVAVLTEYPALRIRVSGHTDSSGDAARNQALSAERAEAVKAYFVSKGVAPERIEAVGLGPSKPIGDNTTRAGRAQNRRIEFELLQPNTAPVAPPTAEPAAPAAAPTAEPVAPTTAPTAPATSPTPPTDIAK